MSDELLLESLLLRYEELVEQGTPVTPEQLCAESPGLMPELKRRIAALRSIDVRTGVRRPPPNSDKRAEATRYTIIAPHAKGGLGFISRAQDHELPRQVAIKEIQPEKDGAAARARFLTEAQLTGSLEHPGIVPVYSLGKFPDGRPFYAMRFITGRSLAQAIDELHQRRSPKGLESTLPHRQDLVSTDSKLAAETREHATPAPAARAPIDYSSLDFRQQLSRFITVCQAIEYAHSRGVIHRDIKPANIMLGNFGETLVVDWGLARSSPDDDSLSVSRAGGEGPQTQQGDIIGTPAYMSPEQASGRADRINTASDIYSLGATLYHLLTGSPPLHGTPVKDLLEKVRAGSIPSPRALQPKIPRALEMVCAKAMSLSSEARYGSARELAEEIERFLADEPVRAWPEPVLTRLARFGRKHRALVRVAAVCLALIATGGAVAAVRENRLRTAANAAHEQRKEALEREAVQAELARQRAAEAIAQSDYTNTYADFLVHEVLTAPRPEGLHAGKGVRTTVKEALDKALPRIAERFEGKPLAEALIRHAAGITYTHLSEYETAIHQLEQAQTLFQRHAAPGDKQLDQCTQNLAAAYAAGGELKQAIPLLEKFLQEGQQISLTARVNLAQAYLYAGRAEEAISQYQAAIAAARKDPDLPAERLLTLFGGLASAYQRGGRASEAIEEFQKLLARMEQDLPAGHPHLITLLNNLGLAYHDVKQFDDAQRLFERARKQSEEHLGDDHLVTLMSLQNLASNLRDMGQPKEAIPMLETAVQRMTARFTTKHYDTLGAMNNLALAYWNAGRADEAIELFDKTLRLRVEHLGPEQQDTLISFENLIVVAAELAKKNPQQAAEHGSKVLLLARQSLPKGHAKIVRAMILLSSTLASIPGRQAEAIKLLEEAVQERKDHPDPADPGGTQAMNALATILRAVNRPNDATPVFEEILSAREKLFPSGHDLRLQAAWNLGAHLQEQENYARAEELLLAVHAELEKSPAASPALAPHIVPRLVSLYTAWGKPEEAAKWRARKPPQR